MVKHACYVYYSCMYKVYEFDLSACDLAGVLGQV